MNRINAIGRRKEATARVYMTPDKKADIIVNKKSMEDYFSKNKLPMEEVMEPFKLLGIDNKYQIKINVKGGGKNGQAGAIKLGISRCLSQLDEQTRKTLRANELLTRDSRMVERKKPGRHKARKSIQFSKR
ncbi:MAG: 30S ribosomal protein S9 [Elusimicrobiota bacterium]|nr:30S ribosomal protein S9 [Elusimicrobiota bacterium]